MAISELGRTKIGCINGLANSLASPGAFKISPLSIRLLRMASRAETAEFCDCPDVI
jgi:hypothetical protein